MNDLATRMQQAQKLLAPYAVPITGTLGRVFAEAPDATRFPFQRDRDRIIHSRSFRRLKGKTQVFVEGEGDHYRTRLTHTMEVAQISRDIARTLQLNEDLAECIALAHDLGHPPFGHAGEETLNTWMQHHGSSFEHNQQSLRIVTVLAAHSSQYAGLNLNREVLEGLMKHRTPHDQSDQHGDEEYHPHSPLSRYSSLEAQVVNLADEIAYTGHDCDDGLRAQLFSLEALCSIPLARDAHERASSRGTSLRGGIIHILVSDVYNETERQLKQQRIAHLDDVYNHAESLVQFSQKMRQQLDALRAFLWNNMYMHPTVTHNAHEGQRIVLMLCEQFFKEPPPQVLSFQTHHHSSLEEAVKDYVAGMTDTFATTAAMLHLC